MLTKPIKYNDEYFDKHKEVLLNNTSKKLIASVLGVSESTAGKLRSIAMKRWPDEGIRMPTVKLYNDDYFKKNIILFTNYKLKEIASILGISIARAGQLNLMFKAYYATLPPEDRIEEEHTAPKIDKPKDNLPVSMFFRKLLKKCNKKYKLYDLRKL